MMRRVIILAVLGCLWTLPAMATPSAEAVKETAELVLKKLGAQAGHETVETISVRLERLAARHGDDAVLAARKVGPQAMHLLETAGAEGPQMARLMAKYGDEGLYLAARPQSVALYTKYGDDAAEALIKHKGIEPFMDKMGKEGAVAIRKLDHQQAMQMVIMADTGQLAKIGRTPEVMAVIGKYGNKAMEFVWNHKGALMVSATLAAFLADPKPFIDGTVKIAEGVTDQVVAPLAQAPAEAVKEVGNGIGKGTNWTLVIGLCIGVTAAWLTLRTWLLLRNNRRRRQQ